MKATVSIAFTIRGPMYDSVLNNGCIRRTSKKGALLIEGDHKEHGRCIVWIAPGMIQEQLDTYNNTTYILYKYFKSEINYKPLKKGD